MGIKNFRKFLYIINVALEQHVIINVALEQPQKVRSEEVISAAEDASDLILPQIDSTPESANHKVTEAPKPLYLKLTPKSELSSSSSIVKLIVI